MKRFAALLSMLAFYALSTSTPASAQREPGRLSLNLQNIEVRAALFAIAKYSGSDMVISDAVKGQISIIMQDVSWQQGLELILKASGLGQQRYGKVLYIARKEDLLAQDKQHFDATQQRQGFQDFITEAFPLQHRQAVDIRKLIEEGKMLSGRGHLLADTSTNTIFVSDQPERVEQVRKVIRLADKAIRQVLIEARIVEANDNFSRDIGARLHFASVQSDSGSNRAGNPRSAALESLTGDINLPIPGYYGSIAALFRASANTLINLELQAMQAENRGQIVSSPRLLTTDQTEATIEEGTEIPYSQASSRHTRSTLFKKAVLSLKVTPRIAAERNTIWLNIDINKDSPKSSNHVGEAPSVNTKRIHTQVEIENGGTVVLGGIYTENNSRTDNKVPFWGDIPWLGKLFSRQQTQSLRRELLIFITPRILAPL
jgi:type IV pilus assembly protein PilQ